MEQVEALIFRNDYDYDNEIDKVSVHDEKFADISKKYKHFQTTDGSMIIIDEETPYYFRHITDKVSENMEELINESEEKDLLEIDEIGIAIDHDFDSNIMFNYDDEDFNFIDYFEDEYAEYYDREKKKITGYIFLNDEDAYLLEKVQEIQVLFAKENGLEVDFTKGENQNDKIKELADKVKRYIEEEFYDEYLSESWYLAISPGNTSRFGGVILSPFWDDTLENAWLKINMYSSDNMFVVKVKEYEKLPQEQKKFDWDTLQDFIERFEYLETIDEDSDNYFDLEDNIEIYKEIKEHCINILGEEYFE